MDVRISDLFFLIIMDIPSRSWPILRSQSHTDKKGIYMHHGTQFFPPTTHAYKLVKKNLLLNIDIWVKQRHAAGLNGVPKKLYWHAEIYMISCFTKMKYKNIIQRFLWNTLMKHNMISWEFHLDWNFHANTQWKRRNTRNKHRTNTQRMWDGKHKRK